MKAVLRSAVCLLPGDVAHRWFSPGSEEQLAVDNVVAGFLLPVSPRQINRGDQLRWWNERGWLAPALDAKRLAAIPRLASPDATAVPLETRVRSYLDVNCSACHRPSGPSRGNFDARFMVPLAEQKLLDGDLAAGDLGISGARVIVPGKPEKSVLLRRLTQTDFFRMPPVSVNDEPQPIVPILKQWIEGMHNRAAAK